MTVIRALPHTPNSWPELIDSHLLSYPAMTIQDVYKLIYQGVRGPEHNIPFAEVFIERLRAELANLQPDPGEPLLAVIQPGGHLLRIHLRPWLALGQAFSSLTEACLETARRPAGGPQDLQDVWAAFLVDLKDGRFPSLSVSDALDFSTVLVENNFPPVHHSNIYSACYHPAYRLVAAEVLSKPTPGE